MEGITDQMGYIREIFPHMIGYRLSRSRIISAGNPINLTFSVTNICQSRCKTCQIWDLYHKFPEKRDEELTLGEIEKVFQSMGHIYIFNVSGGEPFLRPDIVEIIDLACKYLKPGVIHIPTNAIAVDKIEIKTREILKIVSEQNDRIQVTIKPSLDHIGEKHDQIRGIPGNFKKVLDSFNRLKALKSDFPFLHVELGTVLSQWNVNDIQEIMDYILALGPDSYRHEIAEQRSEMFNLHNSISPSMAQYEKAIDLFINTIKENMKERILFQRITNAFRLKYYDLALSLLKEQRQVIPCYAGISNVHLSPYGDVWPCCTLGYDKSMGNVRDSGYDFKVIWRGKKAAEVRSYIKNKNCFCPLANQSYSNMLLHASSLFKVLRQII